MFDYGSQKIFIFTFLSNQGKPLADIVGKDWAWILERDCVLLIFSFKLLNSVVKFNTRKIFCLLSCVAETTLPSFISTVFSLDEERVMRQSIRQRWEKTK